MQDESPLYEILSILSDIEMLHIKRTAHMHLQGFVVIVYMNNSFYTTGNQSCGRSPKKFTENK